MKKIGDTELIINDQNRIYHLNLKEDEVANKIILVGDPQRVSQISKKFQKIEHKIEIKKINLENKDKNNVIKFTRKKNFKKKKYFKKRKAR